MRAILVLLIIIVVAAIAAISLGYINVSQTKTAALPQIKVEGGSAPAFDVQTANVSVGSEKHVVETPTVNVQKPGQ
jgi:predicted S18 family serine protease